MTQLAEAIIQSSISLLRQGGIEAWSIERVARGAGSAKGLVIHHYQTRANLLKVSGLRIGQLRLQRRLGALDTGGTAALDRLWEVLAEDVRSGLSRAAFALGAHQLAVGNREDAERFRKALAAALEVPADALADPVALRATIEGIEWQLVQQVSEAAVRPAYDRLCLALVSPE